MTMRFLNGKLSQRLFQNRYILETLAHGKYARDLFAQVAAALLEETQDLYLKISTFNCIESAQRFCGGGFKERKEERI